MARRSNLLIGGIVVLAAGGIGLAYTGLATPYVTPAQLPGTPVHAFVAVVVLVFGAAVLVGLNNGRAWKRMGQRAGLSPEGGGLLGKPDFTGTVNGRQVRVRTYSTRSGGGDGGGSSKTFTVVETDLRDPVDWNATFTPADDEDSGVLADIESDAWLDLDGIAVFGDVDAALAGDVLSGPVRDALRDLDGAVSVGDPEQNLRAAMLETLPDDAGSMGGALAKRMLDVGTDPAEGPTTTVQLDDRGLLLDDDELRRRLDAVTAVADSVDAADTAPRH